MFETLIATFPPGFFKDFPESLKKCSDAPAQKALSTPLYDLFSKEIIKTPFITEKQSELIQNESKENKAVLHFLCCILLAKAKPLLDPLSFDDLFVKIPSFTITNKIYYPLIDLFLILLETQIGLTPLKESTALFEKLPLAINFLILQGGLPSQGHYRHFDFSKSVYPFEYYAYSSSNHHARLCDFSAKKHYFNLNFLKTTHPNQKTPLDYFFFRRIDHLPYYPKNQVFQGSYLGKNKVVILRSANKTSLLASQIAHLIAPKYCILEKWRFEQMCFLSLNEGMRLISHKKKIKIQANDFLKGTGFISEILDFLQDLNNAPDLIQIIKSKPKEIPSLYKINFSGSQIHKKIEMSDYFKEKNAILTLYQKTQNDLKKTKAMQKEIISARLMLCFMTQSLLEILVDRVDLKKTDKENTLDVLYDRQTQILNYCLLDPFFNDFIQSEPSLFEECTDNFKKNTEKLLGHKIYHSQKEMLKKHFENLEQRLMIPKPPVYEILSKTEAISPPSSLSLSEPLSTILPNVQLKIEAPITPQKPPSDTKAKIPSNIIAPNTIRSNPIRPNTIESKKGIKAFFHKLFLAFLKLIYAFRLAIQKFWFTINTKLNPQLKSSLNTRVGVQ